MKLSALEIKSQEFKRTLRGLDEAEVQSFLDMVASQWQEVQDDLRRNEERVRELENKIVHYQKIEEALQEALTSAKASSKATVAEAERKAELVVKEAEIRARALSREAEGHVREMHDSATAIGRRRKQMVARLRAFLNSELELLGEYAENLGHEPIPPLPEKLQERAADPVQDAYEAAMHRRTIPAPAVTPVANGRSDDSVASELVADNIGGDETGVTDYASADDSSYASSDSIAEESDYEYAEEEVGHDMSQAVGHVSHDEESQADRHEETHEESQAELEEDVQFERGPVEHQRHAPPDAFFDGEGEGETREIDEDDISHENTEWRIRRILDNLE